MKKTRQTRPFKRPRAGGTEEKKILGVPFAATGRRIGVRNNEKAMALGRTPPTVKD